MASIISFLQYFGITPDKLTPIILVFLIGCFLLYRYCIKAIKSDVSDMNTDLTNINNATTEIQSHFIDAGYKILHPLTMKPGSPLVLTEYGEKLVRESGFYKMFQGENKQKIIDAVKSRRPQTNYDIQEYSREILVIDLIDDPMMKPIKEYVFKNSISIEIILNAAALIVRDEVMKELKFGNNL